MTAQELEKERDANIEYLNSILSVWRSTERKSKKALVFLIIVSIIAVYFTFTYLLGGIWGFVVTFAIIAAGAYFVDTLGISLRKNPASDGKLAYQACITMEILIAIKKGTYRKFGVHCLTTGAGKHHNLYKQFIQFYPEYECKDLEKMAKVDVELKDAN